MNYKFTLAAMALSLATALSASAQENKFEAGASITGNFLRQSSGNSMSRETGDRAGVGANFRYWFTGRQGLEVSWSSTSLFNNYTTPDSAGGFRTRMNEATASYVLRLPTWSSKIQPFVLAGAGALTFTPNGTPAGFASTVAKPTFVYGGGIDAYVTKKLGLRAQYKGFVLADPSFGIANFGTDTTAHMAQPSLGVFWRF